MQPHTFDAFAHLADRHGALALSAMLRTLTPGETLPEIGSPDPQPQLNRFRRAFERATGLVLRYDGAFKTWSYGTQHRSMIEGFPQLDHALIAGIRHLVSPIDVFELRIATLDDWTWLHAHGSRIFQLFESTSLYWHVPDANMLLLVYKEPKEFGRVELTPAGFCFFGHGLVCVIESRYRGGGGWMLQWLQSQCAELVAHHVLSDSSAHFLQRFGFVDVEPPIPESSRADVRRFIQERRATFEAAEQGFGIPHDTAEHYDEDARQRIMVWPASVALEPARIATQLSTVGLTWWYTSRSQRSSRQQHTPEEHRRIADFLQRAFGWDTNDYLRRHSATRDLPEQLPS